MVDTTTDIGELATAEGFLKAFRSRDQLAMLSQSLFESQFPNLSRNLSNERKNMRIQYVGMAKRLMDRLRPNGLRLASMK